MSQLFCTLLAQLLQRKDKRTFPKDDIQQLISECNSYLGNAYFLQEGGESLVFCANDIHLNRVVIVKIFLPGVTEKGLNRAFRGLAIQQKLHNLCRKGVVPEVFSYRFEQDPFVVMEFIEGRDLFSYMIEQDKKSRLKTVIAVGEFLSEIHSKNIIHSDIKFENIIVSPDGKIALLDWGLALDLESPQNRLTKKTEGLGTVGFSAPEQVGGEAYQRDYRSDIYSLGIIFYEAIARQHPILDTKQIPAISTFNKSLLDWDEFHILSKATHRNKNKRYVNVVEMLTDVKRLISEPEKLDFAEESKVLEASKVSELVEIEPIYKEETEEDIQPIYSESSELQIVNSETKDDKKKKNIYEIKVFENDFLDQAFKAHCRFTDLRKKIEEEGENS